MSGTFQSRMTSKGQVTVPAELRRELGLKPGDRVEFVRENGTIRVRKAESVVRRLAGSVPGRGITLDADDIHDIVAQGVADDYERELKQLHEELNNEIS